MRADVAETGRLQPLLARLGTGPDRFVHFKHPDALHGAARWRQRVDQLVP